MKILFVQGVSDLYGASRSLLRLASRLVVDKNSVAVVLPGNGPLAARLIDAGAQICFIEGLPVIHRHLLKSPWGLAGLITRWPRAARRIMAIGGEFHADLIHTNQAMVPGVGAWAARRLGVPHIQHVREFFSEAPLLWPLYRWFLGRGSQRIVCVSQAVAAQFNSRDGRVRVLYNGFPRAEFEPVDPDAVSAFRAQYGLGGHSSAGVVGRIKMGRKGQDVFIRAASEVVRHIPQAKFVIAGLPFPGNESHEQALHQLAQKLGLKDNVVFTGELPDARVAFSAVDIVVQPAAMPEPFGGTVIEAMALGKPVIGTRTGGTPEQIEDGVGGILVPPGDTAALSEAMLRLMSDRDLAISMGRSGNIRFSEAFEFERFYSTLIDMYKEAH